MTQTYRRKFRDFTEHLSLLRYCNVEYDCYLIWNLNEIHIPLEKSSCGCQELMWLKEVGRFFGSGTWGEKRTQERARCLYWVFIMSQVLATWTKSEEYDFTTDSIRERSTNRGATLAYGRKCPTEIIFPTSHGLSMPRTREDSGAYKASLALWEFIALEALRTTSLGTDVSVVAEQKKKKWELRWKTWGKCFSAWEMPFSKMQEWRLSASNKMGMRPG